MESQDKLLTHLNFIQALENKKIKFALDDFLCDKSIFCSASLMASPVVKIDKIFLQRIKEDSRYENVLQGVVSYCKAAKKMIILEGIETEEDLLIAKRNHIDLVQGFYFRDLFSTSNSLKSA